MDSNTSQGDWTEYRNQILADLKRANRNIEILSENITNLKVEVGRLKLVSAISGGAAGIIVTLILMYAFNIVAG